MPLDGTVIANICHELNNTVAGGRVEKIYQPEADELVMTIRSRGASHRLLLSASASHPRLHLIGDAKTNPPEPPAFCMVLRKHLNGARLSNITQPGFERIAAVTFEALNEMGDYSEKKLIVEMMGKHSNIILTDAHMTIIDSIKRVSRAMSSVREVLPGRGYVSPPSGNKKDASVMTRDEIYAALARVSDESLQKLQLYRTVMDSFNGISPAAASELCARAGADASSYDCDPETLKKISTAVAGLFTQINGGEFYPQIVCNGGGEAADFTSAPFVVYGANQKKEYASVSLMLADYYAAKDRDTRDAQRSADLKRLIAQNIERLAKKLDAQRGEMEELNGRDRLRLYGELITANIYAIEKGAGSADVVNYYEDGSPQITIPLDATLSPQENAQKYFTRYAKEKRKHAALAVLITKTEEELDYFVQLEQTLLSCEDETDRNELREELYAQGYIKKRAVSKIKRESRREPPKPLRFISRDGFEILVGKNNAQNDELTFKTASNADVWLHAKNAPGSHVVVRALGNEVPDATLGEAALLAAWYSGVRGGSLAAVDYTLKKNVKKPNGARPGFVIYDNYKTAFVTPDEPAVSEIKKR